MTDRSLTVL